MDNYKFEEFINIANELNNMDVIPLLMGSVGLEVLTGEKWDTQDLDVHVPRDKRGWEVPPESSIQFGIIDTLSTFAGVHLEELEIHQQRGVKYY